MRGVPRRLAAMAAVVLAMAMLTACGSGDDSAATTTTTTVPPPMPAAEWADTVCNDLSVWRDSLLRTAGGLAGSALSGQQSLADVLSTAVEQVKSATGELVDGLKSLGPPSTPDGDKMRQELQSLGSDLSGTADNLRSQASSLSKDSPASQNLSQLATMAQEIETAADEAKQTLSDLQGLDPAGQLKSAFQQSSACQELTGSNGSDSTPPTTN